MKKILAFFILAFVYMNGNSQIIGSTSSCYNATKLYSGPSGGNTYYWSASGGSIIGLRTNKDVSIKWTSSGNRSVSLTVSSTLGINDYFLNVTVYGVLSAGTISNAQSLCSGANPSILINSGSARGGVNRVYQWQKSILGKSEGFENITGANLATYNPAILVKTTWYRRKVSSGANCGELYSNVIKIEIGNIPPPTVADGAAFDDSSLVEMRALSGGYKYNWYDAPSGGNLVFTGSNYQVGLKMGETFFYVESIAYGGCVSSTKTKVTGYMLANPSIDSGEKNTITDANGIFLSTSEFDSYEWKVDGQFAGNTQLINVIHPGTYTVTVQFLNATYTTTPVILQSSRTFWAIDNGNWQDLNLWSLSENGVLIATYPTKGDIVNIKGYSIIVNGLIAAKEVNVNVSNTSNSPTSENATLTIDGASADLTVYGNINIATNGAKNRRGQVKVINSGTLKCIN